MNTNYGNYRRDVEKNRDTIGNFEGKLTLNYNNHWRYIPSRQQIFYCMSIPLHMWLKQKGFIATGKDRNPKNMAEPMFLYDNTDDLKEALTEYFENILGLNKKVYCYELKKWVWADVVEAHNTEIEEAKEHEKKINDFAKEISNIHNDIRQYDKELVIPIDDYKRYFDIYKDILN